MANISKTLLVKTFFKQISSFQNFLLPLSFRNFVHTLVIPEFPPYSSFRNFALAKYPESKQQLSSHFESTKYRIKCGMTSKTSSISCNTKYHHYELNVAILSYYIPLSLITLYMILSHHFIPHNKRQNIKINLITHN